MRLVHFLDQRRFYLWLFILTLGAVAVAQEKPQSEKRYVRWRLIEVARKSLADSSLVQLQQGVSFQKLARRHSLHTSAKEGGEMGWTALDSVDSDFKTVIASLPIGGTSTILQKKMHFFILSKANELPERGYLRWKERKTEVDSLLKSIELLTNTGNAPKTMTLIKEAEERVKQIEDEGAYLRTSNFKGMALRQLGKFAEAAVLSDSMLKISRTVGDTYWEGVALGNLGNSYFLSAQYQRAIAYYDSATVIAREIGDQAREGRQLGNLAALYGHTGNYPQAIAYADSALTIFRAIGDRRAEGIELGHLGNAYRSLGKYQMALSYYNQALGIARATGNRASEAAWLNDLGIVYRSLGQHQQAIAYYDSALVIAREISDRVGEGRHLLNLGNVYDELGQHQLAIAYHDSALVIVREIGDRLVEGLLLGNLGLDYYSLGEYPQAVAYFDSALVIARAIGNRSEEGIELGHLSSAYHSLGQYSQAIAYADSALSIAKENSEAEFIWENYWALAKSHAKMSEAQIDEVITFYDNAVDALEKITGQLSQDVYKLSFLKEKQRLYQDYLDYLMFQPENSHHERALEISEASRTRALRDLLQGQRTQNDLSEDKRREAMKRTEQLFAANTAAQSERSTASEMTRAGAEKRLENWANQIDIPPDTLGSTANAPAIRLPEIQAEARNATLLEYHVLDDGVVIWVVDQTGKIIAVKQNIAKEKLKALIDSTRQVLEVEGSISPNKKPVALGKKARTPLLQTLDALLISPVRSYLPKDSNQPLVILPHDVLFLLPFACLMDSSGQYLAQRYTFSTAPSVGLLKFTREKNREQQDRENSKLLLMGNPRMPDEMWRILPGAEKEVKLIAGLVNRTKEAGFSIPHATPRQALSLIRAQATEAEFRQIASVQNYIHLATHGYVVSDALRCGLVLAKTGKTMETDGILTTAEIFGLPLNAELVVLSACQTGLGEISSDGVAGLSRAFLYAGASSLIVSLWSVPDEATQDLMVKFYEELAVDGNKARALRAAQLATMKKHPHPKDWAGFVLVGQPR